MEVAHSVYTELQGRGGHRALRCQSCLCQAVLSSAQGLDETSQPKAPSCAELGFLPPADVSDPRPAQTGHRG